MSRAVIAMIVDEKLKVLHVAEKTQRLDHLQSLLLGRFLCHLDHEPHEVSHIIGLTHPHAAMT